MNCHELILWQTCKRRYKLESTYTYTKHRPNQLLSTVLSRAILDLSNKTDYDIHRISTTAVNTFLSAARSPGIIVPSGIDTYSLTMDYIATIRNIIEYLNRTPLLNLSTPNISPSWSLSSFRDESGLLHLWKFVDSISTDSIIRESHSWAVYGDMAISESPLTLHLISIGRRNKSRLTSHWSRAFRSPAIAKLFKFQMRDGSRLSGNWKTVYFADNPDSDPEVWVDLMMEDLCMDSLVNTVQLKELSPYHIKLFRTQLQYELDEINKVRDLNWFDLPMSRNACDNPTCPHQPVCYSTDPATAIRQDKLYIKRK